MRIDLANYIEEAKKSGMSNKRIYEGLLLSGWGQGNPSPFSEPSAKLPLKPQRQITPVQKKIAIFFLVALILLFGAFVYAQKLARENYDKVSAVALEAQWKTEEIKQKRLQNPTVTINSTADWQTYRNDEYGFEFKYPEEWELENEYSGDDGMSVGFHEIKNSNLTLFISVGDEDEKNGIERLAAEQKSEIKKSARTIGGVDADYFGGVIEFSSYNAFIFSQNNNYFVISDYNIDKLLLNQILSTFRFVSPTGSRQGQSIEGQFCGGITAFQCPDGYMCKLDGDYPDAGGKCVRSQI